MIFNQGTITSNLTACKRHNEHVRGFYSYVFDQMFAKYWEEGRPTFNTQ